VTFRRAARIGAPTLWVLASIAMILSVGVPTSHDLVFFWFALGILSFSVTDVRRKTSRLVIEWSPFVAVLFIYDRLRGYADGLLFHAREVPQIKIEAAIFGRPIPTVWLQAHLWHGANDLRWWDYATWFIYLTHFFAALVVAAVLWRWAHDRFVRFATMVCVLSLAGFATYVLFPAVPPWLAARHGSIGSANRTIAIVWHHVPIAHFGSLFEKGQTYANNVAAMPSLHAAFSLLIVLYVWRLVPRWTRPLLALYPPAMAFSLVYTGEHYVVDCVAGWAYAVATFVAVNLAFDYHARRVTALEPALAD
jgi:membrane-associated phospholipid phosphatase